MQISRAGGCCSFWSSDSSSLYYSRAGRLYAVTVQNSPRLTVGQPVLVLDRGSGHHFLAAGDQGRFLVLEPQGDLETVRLTVVNGWLRTLSSPERSSP